VDLSFTPEQEDFAQACRRLVGRYWPLSDLAQLAESGSGHSDILWRHLASAGWLGVPFAEDLGGGGASVFELGLAYRESGRALVPTTLASTMFAGLLIQRLGRSDQLREWLPRITHGDAVATVAFAEPGAHYLAEWLTTDARLETDGWHLNGEKAFVPNGRRADVTVVAGKVAASGSAVTIGLFLVPRDTPGLELVDHATFQGHPEHVMRLTDARLADGALLGDVETVAATLAGYEEVNDTVTALQCMEILGGAEKVLEDTCEHVRQREQFGRPLGTFQAVQHIVADLESRIHGGRIAAFRALRSVADGRPAQWEVSIAKAWLSRAYVDITVWAHQLHGGIGYVREMGLYRWSEHAKALEALHGTPEYHLARIADRWSPARSVSGWHFNQGNDRG
jgi:3-oxocholest-4-en-26-oyl-CoA dehydrogenase beta subunit